jgi:peptidoglycan/xylan/chitin deacetylase (PgdA/CDA1 family)
MDCLAIDDAIVTVRIRSTGGRTRASWMEGSVVHFPASLLDRTGWRRAIRSDGGLDVPPEPASIAGDDVTQLRERRAFTERPPLSARLPLNYRIVPGWARAAAASAIGRWNRGGAERWAAFPGWPIDLSADALDDLRERPDARPGDRVDCENRMAPGSPTPVVLTHDIDSAEGLTNLLARFLPLEEASSARSTNYIVPCAYPVDHGLVGEIVARGHHVGVHGYDHSHRTPFATAGERSRRLDAAHGFATRYGAIGYRAPSLLRTRALLRDLATRYSYDSSIPTSGGLFPVPNNGCATARPFLVEGIVELPVTLPRDGTLRFLGCSPREIVQTWIECAETISRARGVVVLLTHGERRFSGADQMIAAYAEFLEHIRARPDRFAFRTAADLLDRARLLPPTRAPAAPAETDAITRAAAN